MRRLPADKAGIDALMREFFHKTSSASGSDGTVVGAPAAHPAAPRRDFDMATELLDRASRAFDMLMDRCQRLEHDLDDANERARLRGAEQEEMVEQWNRLASGLEARADTAEQGSAALKARCEAAEARAALAEQRAGALERASAQATAHAATADQLSTTLHDRVVAAFGIGSRAHPVLQAVVTRTAAE